jgi:uncharacterized protein YabE (DUF348 family)
MRRSALTLAAQAVLVCLLVGLVVALVGLKKTVTLSVDGEQRTIDTYARTVSDVLDNEGLEVGEHDAVVPAPGESIGDGDLISFRHGRPLMLNVDGQVQEVWTSALDVDEAIGMLGLHANHAYVAVSRSGRIPLEGGVDVTVRTPHTVSVLVDGKRITAATTAATVQELLTELGVPVGPRDIVAPDPTAYPADGGSVTVSRIVGKRLTRQVAVPYRTVRRANPSMYRGTTSVVKQGKPGLVVRKFDLTLRDGKVVGRKLVAQKQRKKPVTHVVEYGTKKRPTYVPAIDDLDWPALARCESGGRPDAVSPNGMYHGLYQFDLQTWRGVGGTGLPSEAPANEQTYRAQKLYADRGAAPWPVCGKYL